MDWTTPLVSQQANFLKRLKSGFSNLLHCEIEDHFSELTVISGQELKKLRDSCWIMAEKYKITAPVRDVFLNNLNGKLGEEVIKNQLNNIISKGNYKEILGDSNKADFNARQWKIFISYIRSYQYLNQFLPGDLFPLGCIRLASNPAIGILVKSCHATADTAVWTITAEEIEKNTVLACVLIHEEVNEAQPEYHLITAGFLPTQLIKTNGTEPTSLTIDNLLYSGGLRSYLEFLQANNFAFDVASPQLAVITSNSTDTNTTNSNSNSVYPAIEIGPWKRPLSLDELLSLETAIQQLKQQQLKATNPATVEPPPNPVQAEPPLAAPPPMPAPTQPSHQSDLNQIWRKVLVHVRPFTMQALLRQHSRLLTFNGQSACIGISSKALFKLDPDWLPKVETSFAKIFMRPIKVSLEVISD